MREIELVSTRCRFKNGTKVSELSDLAGRYEIRNEGSQLVILGKSTEDDYGNYSCAYGGEMYTVAMHGRQHSKLPANTNVVEGQKLKLSCKLIGKPYSNVSWLYWNETTNATDVRSALGDRVQLMTSEQGVPGAELVVAEAMREDAGHYQCVVGSINNGTTQLRVKDMYAALWPFLGICAEVFVLCAIILVYERRRTKPELDDSDTDNHDQYVSSLVARYISSYVFLICSFSVHLQEEVLSRCEFRRRCRRDRTSRSIVAFFFRLCNSFFLLHSLIDCFV